MQKCSNRGREEEQCKLMNMEVIKCRFHNDTKKNFKKAFQLFCEAKVNIQHICHVFKEMGEKH